MLEMFKVRKPAKAPAQSADGVAANAEGGTK
jgi:hypothetical protein